MSKQPTRPAEPAKDRRPRPQDPRKPRPVQLAPAPYYDPPMLGLGWGG